MNRMPSRFNMSVVSPAERNSTNPNLSMMRVCRTGSPGAGLQRGSSWWCRCTSAESGERRVSRYCSSSSREGGERRVSRYCSSSREGGKRRVSEYRTGTPCCAWSPPTLPNESIESINSPPTLPNEAIESINSPPTLPVIAEFRNDCRSISVVPGGIFPT
jgi:hypothetical protein